MKLNSLPIKIWRLLKFPLAAIIKRKYRPTSVLQKTTHIENSVESFEPDKSRLRFTNSSDKESINQFEVPRIYKINKGTVNTDNVNSDCFLTQKRELISDLTFSYIKGKKVPTHKNNIFSRYFESKPPLEYRGTVFSLLSGGGGTGNYYHWLFDALPRLKILQESPLNDKIDKYLAANLKTPYKLQTLKYFGITRELIIDSTEFPHLRAESLIAVTHPNKPDLPSIPLWICDFLRESFLVNESSNNTRKIFISRKKAAKRRILNEDSFFEDLIPFGFERIFLEELTFPQQVDLFSNAQIIISPHGAGLANLVFSQPGTRVIEIFPPNSTSNIYSNLSNNTNLSYQSYFGIKNPNDPETDDLHADFLVEKEELLKLLQVRKKQAKEA